MTEKDIKPIPKYILRMIEREDKNEFPVPSKQLRFYAYLTKYRGELVKVTVAVKHYRRKLYCKAVAWHGVHSPKCYVKDLEYCYCGSMGFRVGWHDEGNTPFVTVEYSLQNHKVLQCYGEHDHRPNEDVLHYVNKVWLPYANKTLKKLAA